MAKISMFGFRFSFKANEIRQHYNSKTPKMTSKLLKKKANYREILPPIRDIISATLFWHWLHRTSAERTISWTCFEPKSTLKPNMQQRERERERTNKGHGQGFNRSKTSSRRQQALWLSNSNSRVLVPITTSHA